MRIVFFGSGNFAVPVLENLICAGYEICCVVTQPDKKAGRYLKITAPIVKSYCLKHNLAMFQPDKLGSEETYRRLKELNADLFVVVSYGKIIPKRIIEIPKFFSLNVHASLLPKYRGASPINRVIMQGEKETGVSIIKMNEFMDKGDIVLRKSIKISDNDDARSLSGSLAKLGGSAIIEAIDLIKASKYTLEKQAEKAATYADKLTKEDGLIDWNKDRKEIFNQIRGLIPWPGAYTYFGAKILKVWKVEYVDLEIGKQDKETAAATVLNIAPVGITICCGDGPLVIKEVQPASGRIMPAYDFALGHKIKIGNILGQ